MSKKACGDDRLRQANQDKSPSIRSKIANQGSALLTELKSDWITDLKSLPCVTLLKTETNLYIIQPRRGTGLVSCILSIHRLVSNVRELPKRTNITRKPCGPRPFKTVWCLVVDEAIDVED